MSQFDLEFHWTRPPSDKPLRAGWVLHDEEVGSLVRHTGQWLLTLRLTPRCSCGWKEIDIYIYIHFSFFGCAGSSLLRGLSPSFGELRLLSSCRAQVSHCRGFSLWSPGSGAQAHGGVSGAYLLPHGGSSQTRFISNTDVLCQSRG